jgi:hypothetical protein
LRVPREGRVLSKIVSGGQTGADRAALDVAIELGIPHGGWVPKGRRAEDGVISDKYNLKETAAGDYAERTERNVLDSDGTLIISHGDLVNGSMLTRDMAIRHDRPWLHADLEKTNSFVAVTTIQSWIAEQGIRVLNVAGPRSSRDPHIYKRTRDILKTLIYLDTFQGSMPVSRRGEDDLPRTVGEAVSRISSRLSLRDRAEIARMSPEDLASLDRTLGEYIRNRFGLRGDNGDLMESCGALSIDGEWDAERASGVIIWELWKSLGKTHRLRRVK